MKSAYELAMERLSRQAPAKSLTPGQKERIAELDSVYRARIAGRDLATQDEVARLLAAGDAEKAAQAQAEFNAERQKLEAELESRKEEIRNEKAR